MLDGKRRTYMIGRGWRIVTGILRSRYWWGHYLVYTIETKSPNAVNLPLPMTLKELLHEIACHHETQTGEMPKVLHADKFFRQRFLKEIEPQRWFLCERQMPDDEFEFMGIRVISDLDAPHPTLVAPSS